MNAKTYKAPTIQQALNQIKQELGPEAVIVTLAVDTGFKYMSVAPYGDI